MKPQHIIFFTLFLLASAWPLVAQDIEFERISPKYEEFSIDIPKTDHIDVGRKRSAFSYIVQHGNTHIFLFGYDEKDSELLQFVNDFLATAKSSAVKSSESAIDYDIFDFKTEDDFIHKLIFAKTKKRNYIFQFVTIDSEKYIVDRVVSSLRLDNTPEPMPAFADDKSILLIDRKTLEPSFPQPLFPSSIPIKKQDSDGSGNDEAKQNAPPIAAPSYTENYKILDKPRAEYPFFARTYGVQGIIRVRVILSKNGTVESPTAIGKLPFGLTKAALEAASKIKFTPRLKENGPVTVSVAVDYGFHIY